MVGSIAASTRSRSRVVPQPCRVAVEEEYALDVASFDEAAQPTIRREAQAIPCSEIPRFMLVAGFSGRTGVGSDLR